VPVVKEKEIFEIELPLEDDILDEDAVVEALVVKDPDKLFVNRAIAFTLEKIDETF